MEEIFEISGKALMLSYWKLAQGQQCARHNSVLTSLYSTSLDNSLRSAVQQINYSTRDVSSI